MTVRRPLRIGVKATGQPEPHLLRAAIAARLERRPFPARVEDQVAERIAEAVRAETPGGRPWR
jgi:hypothetical protein